MSFIADWLTVNFLSLNCNKESDGTLELLILAKYVYTMLAILHERSSLRCVAHTIQIALGWCHFLLGWPLCPNAR